MVVEEWVSTPVAGADWQSQVKQLCQILARLGKPCRCFATMTGPLFSVHTLVEFASLAEAETFWSSPPEEIRALTAQNDQIWERSARERNYYKVVV